MSTLWTIIVWLVVGFLAGLIARALVPGKDDIGILRTAVLGIVGSIVGGAVVALFNGGFQTFQPTGFIGSVLGAIVVLVIYNKVTGRKKVRG